ncbi:MAG: hypothetical protein GEV11_02085 [Streptosporangiales bacterium]|nr:hypothetical protein [Streptosporangiales bacterium]
MRKPLRTAALLLALLPLGLTAACGNAQVTGGGDAPFKGETIHFVVSYGPGGGYDLIARAMAKHLEKRLGATVVVENMDGAGGLLAANKVYSAKPDGLTFGIFSGQGMAGSVLGNAEGASFKLPEFGFVARVAADPRVLHVQATGKYKSIEDVRNGKGVRFASSGPGGSEHIDGTVLFPVLGIDGKIITGYKGSAETELAVTSGDADATSGTLGTRLPPIKRGEHRAVLVIGEKRVPELPGVPALSELKLDPGNAVLAKAHMTMQEMGRLVLAPPGVPEDRMAALRKAMAAVCKDPAFLSEMKKSGQPIEHLDGPQAKKVAESVLRAPAPYRALLEKSYRGQ